MSSKRNKLMVDEAAKWKPRNKQAAMVVRPAHWLDQQLPAPTFVESEAERVEAFQKECRVKAEALAKIPGRPQEPKMKAYVRHAWAGKYLRQLAKSRGLPPPTAAEIDAFKRAQPHYGEVKT